LCCFAGPHLADELDLLRRNCRSLIVGAMAEQPARFSARFRRGMARQWPFSLRALCRLRRRAERRCQSLDARSIGSLAEGVDSRPSRCR